MLLRNDFLTDPRAKKMAEVISECGHDVIVMSFVNVKKYDHYSDGKITVICFESGVENAKKIAKTHDNIPTSKIKIDRTFIAFLYILYLNFKFAYYFFKYVSKRNIVCVHANDFDTLPSAYFISRIIGCKLVYDSHELFNELYSDYTRALKNWLKFLECWLIRKCDAIYTVNEDIASIIFERYGVKPDVVMNCPRYQNIIRDHTDNTLYRIIYLGSYNEERCIECIIKSTKYLKMHGWNVFLRGWGNEEGALKKLASEISCDGGGCIFLDPVPTDTIVESLADFDIGIIPYPPNKTLNNKYSSPNKLFEYMMAGVIPVVPHGSTTMERIINEIGCCTFFDACDDKSLYCTIRSLCEDSRFNEYVERCLLLAKNKYNWETQSLPVKNFYCKERVKK